MNNSQLPNNNRDLLKYAGLGTQLLAAIGFAVFLGIKLDKWLGIFPLLTAILPLLILFAIFYKLFRETGGSKSENDN